MKPSTLMQPLALAIAITASPMAAAEGNDQILQEIQAMKEEISQLQQQVNDQAANDQATKDGINVGGAVRFQYSNEGYDRDNRERGGDLDFDLFRLDFNGQVKGIELSAQWRWYQYMNTVHHAWLGYQFDDNNRLQAGVQQVPFGVRPFNSHSFFFSSNFYVGLEDDYDSGIDYQYKRDGWDFNLGYYFNDEKGGIDGYSASDADRYSYDIVGYRSTAEGTYETPANTVAEASTWNTRLAYKLDINADTNIEVGASGQYGQLTNASENVGDRNAYAAHMVVNMHSWNLQLQASSYEYNLDSSLPDINDETIAVGSYAFYDTMPAKADTYTANIAYSLPVTLGPISNLTFYNDYSVITNKSADLKDTWMNVTGMLVSAGSLYTYVDFIPAENQPFMNGSTAGNGEQEQRLNINFGFYF